VDDQHGQRSGDGGRRLESDGENSLEVALVASDNSSGATASARIRLISPTISRTPRR
jgi:hypothetical protein